MIPRHRDYLRNALSDLASPILHHALPSMGLTSANFSMRSTMSFSLPPVSDARSATISSRSPACKAK